MGRVVKLGFFRIGLLRVGLLRLDFDRFMLG